MVDLVESGGSTVEMNDLMAEMMVCNSLSRRERFSS